QVLPAVGVQGTVDSVVLVRRRDLAFGYPGHAIRSLQARKGKSAVEGLRSRIKGFVTAHGGAVGEADTGKSAPQGIACKSSETRRILLEVLKVILAVSRVLDNRGIDSCVKSQLASLVKVVVALEDREARRDWAIHKVGLGETE